MKVAPKVKGLQLWGPADWKRYGAVGCLPCWVVECVWLLPPDVVRSVERWCTSGSSRKIFLVCVRQEADLDSSHHFARYGGMAHLQAGAGEGDGSYRSGRVLKDASNGPVRGLSLTHGVTCGTAPRGVMTGPQHDLEMVKRLCKARIETSRRERR